MGVGALFELIGAVDFAHIPSWRRRQQHLPPKRLKFPHSYCKWQNHCGSLTDIRRLCSETSQYSRKLMSVLKVNVSKPNWHFFECVKRSTLCLALLPSNSRKLSRLKMYTHMEIVKYFVFLQLVGMRICNMHRDVWCALTGGGCVAA
jgi:hypothetical protein